MSPTFAPRVKPFCCTEGSANMSPYASIFRLPLTVTTPTSGSGVVPAAEPTWASTIPLTVAVAWNSPILASNETPMTSVEALAS